MTAPIYRRATCAPGGWRHLWWPPGYPTDAGPGHVRALCGIEAPETDLRDNGTVPCHRCQVRALEDDRQ